MDDEIRTANKGGGEGRIDLVEFLIVLAKHKGLIIGLTVAAAVLAAGISLSMPPLYLARAKFFASTPNPGLFSQDIDQYSGTAAFTGVAKSLNNVCVELLKTKPVLDRIIDRFDLMNIYSAKTRAGARSTLAGRIRIQYGAKSSVITLGVEDCSAQRAAAMANAFIEELRNRNKDFTPTEMSPASVVIEKELKKAQVSLVKAQDDMNEFQDKHATLEIDSQALDVIERLSQMRAQIAVKELRLKLMQNDSSSQAPGFQTREAELKTVRDQAAQLESENTRKATLEGKGAITSAGMVNAQLMRDLIFKATLVELLLNQYHSAKLETMQDAFVIQVIEKAEAPAHKKSPQRTQMMVLGAIIGFLCAIMAVSILEFKDRVSADPARKERLEELKHHLLSWRSNRAHGDK